MKEKFSQYESERFISKTGEFVFEVKEYALKDSSKGNPMAEFVVSSEEGQTIIRHSLSPKARWSYNNLIKACLNLDTKEKIEAFECDYETIGQDLVGKKFIGVVKKEIYTKVVKVPQEDGTFADSEEEKEAYKIDEYKFVK